jgi:Bacterial SH3 domain
MSSKNILRNQEYFYAYRYFFLKPKNIVTISRQNAMRTLSVAKSSFALVFYLGVIAAVVYGAWRYVILPYRAHPVKPMYANDYKKSAKKKSVAFAAPAAQSKKPSKTQPKSDSKAPLKTTLDTKYKGTVNSGIGLVLRSQPSQDANKIGGADYNSTLSVLKESPDREWVYVRQEDTQEEGWIRSGNLNRN